MNSTVKNSNMKKCYFNQDSYINLSSKLVKVCFSVAKLPKPFVCSTEMPTVCADFGTLRKKGRNSKNFVP